MNLMTAYGHGRAALLGLASAFLLNACVNEPGPVGSGLLPASDLVRGDTLDLPALQSSSVTSVPDSFIAWSTVAIGKRGTAEAWGILRFDGFAQALNNISVKQAEIRMARSYHLGDTTSQISLEVGKILTDWRASNLTYESVQMPGFFETPVPPSTLVDDTTLVFSLDTALVSSWFRSDSTNPNYGIVLKPTNPNVLIRGFLQPQLYFVYTLPDSADTDTTTFSASIGDFGFVLGSPDTSSLSDSTLISIRAGAAYRGLLQFDISGLPGFAAVHRALLEVSSTADTSNFSSSVQDSLMAIFVDETGFVETLESLSEVSVNAGVKTYIFNVTTMVQFWAQGLAVPRLGLRALNERNAVDGFLLHGSASVSPALRPRLRIVYSGTRE